MIKITPKEWSLYILKELLWLAITGLITYAILYPITQKIDYIYWKVNAFIIFLAITYFRYSVTFKSLPFLRPGVVRFLLFTVNLSVFIYVVHHMQRFVGLADNFYIEDFGFPKVIMYEDVKMSMFKYLYREFVLFGSASLIMISAFQMRLIISYWQYYRHQANARMED